MLKGKLFLAALIAAGIGLGLSGCGGGGGGSGGGGVGWNGDTSGNCGNLLTLHPPFDDSNMPAIFKQQKIDNQNVCCLDSRYTGDFSSRIVAYSSLLESQHGFTCEISYGTLCYDQEHINNSVCYFCKKNQRLAWLGTIFDYDGAPYTDQGWSVSKGDHYLFSVGSGVIKNIGTLHGLIGDSVDNVISR